MDAISIVKETVSEANLAVANAQVEAKEKYDSAIKDLDSQYESRTKELNESGKEIIENARKEVEDQAAIKLSAGDKASQEVSNISQAKIDQAVNFVVERIVKV